MGLTGEGLAMYICIYAYIYIYMYIYVFLDGLLSNWMAYESGWDFHIPFSQFVLGGAGPSHASRYQCGLCCV